jgi:CheY-like chemotaxis protein
MVETMTSTSRVASYETHVLARDKQAQIQTTQIQTTRPHPRRWGTRQPLEHRTHGHDARAATIRCLIVDDNNHFCQVASDVLERGGIAIIGNASTSTEALRLIDEVQPDVALVDIVLGKESGVDLAEQLTAATFTEPTTVILMSASCDEEDVAHLIVAGTAAAFLPKIDISGTAIREIYRQHRS